MKRRKRRTARRAVPPGAEMDAGGRVGEFAGEVASHPETSPVLTGGDPDADWVGAYATGEEAVGGSVATPDQDVVDEIGRALGVEQASDAPVRTSDEILRLRDRLRWHLERDALDAEEGRPHKRRP